jgi:hypothetical protein
MISHTTDSDGAPSYAASVVGTGVKIYATKTAGSGKARIYIDNVLKQTVDLKATATAYQLRVYAASFALGKHTIRIEPVGTANGATSVVGFDLLTIR